MLELRDVSFCYPGGKQLLSKVMFHVEHHERVAILGPSGIGKSTLCRLMAGFEDPSSGQVLLDGNPLPKKGSCPVQLISQHPESAVDPRMRMKKTLLEAGGIDRDLLDDLGIRPEWLSRYPHELSGGELQRFCIARALMANPRFLIADEISTMLDAVTQAQIWQYLISEADRRQMGIIFVSHSPALVKRIANRTFSLEKPVDIGK